MGFTTFFWWLSHRSYGRQLGMKLPSKRLDIVVLWVSSTRDGNFEGCLYKIDMGLGKHVLIAKNKHTIIFGMTAWFRRPSFHRA